MTLEQMPDPVLRIGVGGRILATNGAASKLLGGDLTGETVATALHVGDVTSLPQRTWFETRIPTALGQHLPVRLWIAATDDGHIMHIRPEDGPTEDALHTEYLAKCVSESLWPVIMCHPDGRIYWRNPSAAEMQEIGEVGDNIAETFLNCGYQTDQVFRLNAALQAPRPKKLTLTGPYEGKIARTLSAYVLPLSDPRDAEPGAFTGLASVTLRDVSQRQMNRIKLERLQRAAFETEERLSHAFELLPHGLAIFDSNDVLVTANEAYQEVLGLRNADIKPGMSFEDIAMESARQGVADTRGKRLEDWIQALKSERWDKDHNEVEVHRPDGRWIRRVESRATNGDLVCVRSDITAQKVRERELVEARRRAEAATRAKSTFLANMSHEIRTPMNGVVGMADLLCETELEEEQRSYAETIRSSAEALLVIINDVLDFSKIEADKLELYPAPFDLERMIQDVVRMLQPSANERRLDISLEFSPQIPRWYLGDKSRIRQVVTNLIGNAVKFTIEGHVAIRVEGTSTPQRDGVDLSLTVQDTGIGIPSETLPHVFGEFTQADMTHTRNFEGTGLGLAITKRIVELMGGEVWVESTLGEGSVFGFRLWLPWANLFEHTNDRANSRADVSGVRALLIDHTAFGRAVMSKYLDHLGVSFTSCETAEAVMSSLADSQPQIVLADHIPDAVDGIALAQEILDAGYQTPLIILGSNGLVDQPPHLPSNVRAFVQKPVTMNEIARLLEQNVLQPDRPSQTAKLSVVPDERTFLRGRLLIVDDNKTNRLVLRKMLKSWSGEIEEATNGAEAVAKYGPFAPDLILMDVSMPVMDGIEATRLIRTEEEAIALDRCPIIAFSANAMSGDREKYLAAGMDGYIPKPVKKAALFEVLATHLGS